MNRKNDSGWGWLGALIVIALVIAGIIYAVSGVGHLLGLTPTGSEVLDKEDGYVAAHYEGVAAGYVLTVLIMALPVGAYFLLTWWQRNRPGDDRTFWQIAAGTATLFLVLVLALPVGARETALDRSERDGSRLASGEAAASERGERRQARAEERRLELRLERQEARREARRDEVREEARLARQKVQLASQEAPAVAEQPATSSCDSNYSGACLDPNASDYDCQGGEGDGPEYTGFVTVVGDDRYGLDADSDGTGCE